MFENGVYETPTSLTASASAGIILPVFQPGNHDSMHAARHTCSILVIHGYEGVGAPAGDRDIARPLALL